MKPLKFVGLLLLILGAMPSFAQDLSKKQVHEITQEMITTIEEHYIIPELRDKIVEGLTINLREGKYDQISSKKEFEQILTKDLYQLSDDKHLYLVHNNDQGAASPRRQMMRRMPDPKAFENLLSYQLLEGNIAYLNVPMFAPLEYLQEDIDQYLEMSLSADALIIDLRQCPGGSGITSAYLAGGFIAQPTHLTTYYSKDGSTKAFSTKTKFGEANQDKEVYVLLSERTGSAGEGFAFYLQQLGRVKVIGMQSLGAGRSNQFFSIKEDFRLSVSVRTSITPNGKQFQGIGVKPDIITPTKNALDQAKIEAYLHLADAKPNMKSNYEQLISKTGQPEVKAQRNDRAAIKASVLGYIENFFENNTEEMYQYLHPELAKRGLSKKRGESSLFFQNMSQAELKEMLQKKKPLPKVQQANTVEILDVFYNSASVRLKTGYPGMQWIEYILLARIEEEWKIVDILWDYYPRTKSVSVKK